MRHAGMLGLERQDAVEHLGRLLLFGVGLVGRRVVGHAEQRQRAEDGDLVIVGVTAGEAGHGGLERGDALGMQPRRRLDVEGADGADPIRFLGHARRHRGGLLRCGAAARDLLLGGRTPDHVVVRHGDAPLGHRALGIGRGNLVEGRLGPRVAEGMHEGDGAVEVGLLLGRAGNREVHFAQ